MRRLILHILSSLLLLVYFSISGVSAENGPCWVVDSIEQGEPSGYLGTSLRLDSAGHPHIAYSNFTNAHLQYVYHDGSRWHFTTVDNAERVGLFPSLVLDSHDRPHIGYMDWANNDLKYAFYDGSSWQIQTVDSGEVVGFPSLALDPAGQPAISYWGDNSELEYTQYNGTVWQSAIVDQAPGWMGATALAFDTLGQPHIAYSSGGGLKYAYSDGKTWSSMTVSPLGGYSAALALDTSNEPHITAFYYNLAYAYFDGVNWETTTIDETEGLADNGPIGFTALALDNADLPHIAYCRSREILNYARFDGKQWQIEIVDNNLTDFCSHGSLALTADARAAISYVGGSRSAGYELKYAYCAPTVLPESGGSTTPFWPGIIAGLGISIAGLVLVRKAYASPQNHSEDRR